MCGTMGTLGFLRGIRGIEMVETGCMGFAGGDLALRR